MNFLMRKKISSQFNIHAKILDCVKFTNPSKKDLPFERNEKSLAYVDYDDQPDDVYVQGCIWGGKVPKVLDMIDELRDRINKDLQNDIIAVVRDESHLNKYRLENIDNFNIIPPSYAKPEITLPISFCLTQK